MRFHNCATVGVLVIVVSTLFLASASASTVALPRKLLQPDDLILKLCKKVYYVNLCIKSVTKNIKGTPTGISILNAEIDATIKGVNVALTQVANLSKSASSKQEKMILSTCDQNYEFALDSLNDAKTSIISHDRESVRTQLTAMLNYVSTCADSYAKFNITSPLKELNALLGKLEDNSLGIAKQIVI